LLVDVKSELVTALSVKMWGDFAPTSDSGNFGSWTSGVMPDDPPGLSGNDSGCGGKGTQLAMKGDDWATTQFMAMKGKGKKGDDGGKGKKGMKGDDGGFGKGMGMKGDDFSCGKGMGKKGDDFSCGKGKGKGDDFSCGKGKGKGDDFSCGKGKGDDFSCGKGKGDDFSCGKGMKGDDGVCGKGMNMKGDDGGCGKGMGKKGGDDWGMGMGMMGDAWGMGMMMPGCMPGMGKGMKGMYGYGPWASWGSSWDEPYKPDPAKEAKKKAAEDKKKAEEEAYKAWENKNKGVYPPVEWLVVPATCKEVAAGYTVYLPAMEYHKEKEIFGDGHKILQDFFIKGEEYTMVQTVCDFDFDFDCKLYPEVHAAWKEAGNFENSCTIAKCPQLGQWGAGFGSKDKGARAAKLALSIAIAFALDPSEYARVAADYPEFGKLCGKAQEKHPLVLAAAAQGGAAASSA